jgi:hypothetical protein
MRHELSGIDGRNPSGFLAALGTLRLLTDFLSADELRLAWDQTDSGHFRPILDTPDSVSREDLVGIVLEAHLSRDLDAELGWAADVMKLPCDDLRNLLASAHVEPASRRAAEMIGACVVDVPRRQRGKPHPEQLAAYTPLRLIPRVGRARFVSTAYAVSKSVKNEAQVSTALFGPWKYVKSNSLRWDPGARVPLRAYSAEAPTNFGPLGVPAATALAVAALCYFPLIFAGDGGRCAGFDSSRATTFRWPLWSPPLSEGAVRTILCVPAIHERELDTNLLHRYGIFARISARREKLGDDGQLLAWGEVDRVEVSSASP